MLRDFRQDREGPIDFVGYLNVSVLATSMVSSPSLSHIVRGQHRGVDLRSQVLRRRKRALPEDAATFILCC